MRVKQWRQHFIVVFIIVLLLVVVFVGLCFVSTLVLIFVIVIMVVVGTCALTLDFRVAVVKHFISNRGPLVCTDDELAQELVAQGVEIITVELGGRALLEVLLMLVDMSSHFS